jgi:hypothetical protein
MATFDNNLFWRLRDRLSHYYRMLYVFGLDDRSVWRRIVKLYAIAERHGLIQWDYETWLDQCGTKSICKPIKELQL